MKKRPGSRVGVLVAIALAVPGGGLFALTLPEAVTEAFRHREVEMLGHARVHPVAQLSTGGAAGPIFASSEDLGRIPEDVWRLVEEGIAVQVAEAYIEVMLFPKDEVRWSALRREVGMMLAELAGVEPELPPVPGNVEAIDVSGNWTVRASKALAEELERRVVEGRDTRMFALPGALGFEAQRLRRARNGDEADQGALDLARAEAAFAGAIEAERQAIEAARRAWLDYEAVSEEATVLSGLMGGSMPDAELGAMLRDVTWRKLRHQCRYLAATGGLVEALGVEPVRRGPDPARLLIAEVEPVLIEVEPMVVVVDAEPEIDSNPPLLIPVSGRGGQDVAVAGDSTPPGDASRRTGGLRSLVGRLLHKPDPEIDSRRSQWAFGRAEGPPERERTSRR